MCGTSLVCPATRQCSPQPNTAIFVERMPHCKFAGSWLGLRAAPIKAGPCSSSNAANFVKGSWEQHTWYTCLILFKSYFVLEEDVAFEALLEKRVHQDYDKDSSMQLSQLEAITPTPEDFAQYSWKFWNMLRDHAEILHVDSWLGIEKSTVCLIPIKFYWSSFERLWTRRASPFQLHHLPLSCNRTWLVLAMLCLYSAHTMPGQGFRII